MVVGRPVPLSQLEQLVDLLLVFGDRDARLAVARIGREFVRRHVRKHRGGKGAQGHRRKNCAVKARTVVPDHRERLSRTEAECFKRRRERNDLGKDVGPASLLPHAAVTLAESGPITGFRGVTRERRDQASPVGRPPSSARTSRQAAFAAACS